MLLSSQTVVILIVLRPQVRAVTEFRKVGVKSDAVLSEVMELFGKNVELGFDALELIVKLTMLLAQRVAALFVMAV